MESDLRMKKRWQTGIYLLVYILLLTYISDFNIIQLLDIKSFLILLTGTFLLTLPFYDKAMDKEELLCIYGTKSIEAGLIQVFLLCFVQLSESTGYDKLLADIVLCFRPILYAFCIRLILINDDTKSLSLIETESEKELTKNQNIIMPSYEDCRSAKLTKRESEIALLICQGFSNREIADVLTISEKTVKKHVSNIFDKTNINKRDELIHYLTNHY